jgi:hypothetical protein
MLSKLASCLGVKVSPARFRGEVILTFPALNNTEGFNLRLSQKKAYELLTWIFFYNHKKNTEEG